MDLAGSEGASKTRSEGLRLREDANINKSLLSLSTVIHNLSYRQQSSRDNYYINYRDSKLTRILQNFLSGNSQIFIICCINQLTQNTQETLQTLYFGKKAKQIRTQVRVNEFIRESQEEIALKISKMHQVIEQQKTEIVKRDHQIQ